jgi:transcriptional regulator with XRE-family HTH domain
MCFYLQLFFLYGICFNMETNVLKQRRERLGMTQADLSKYLGVASNTVSRYETGSLPIPAHMDLVLEALEVRHVEDMQKTIREGR